MPTQLSAQKAQPTEPLLSRCAIPRACIAAYGLAILVLTSIHLFLVPQSTSPDTDAFLNPPYEFVHQGRVVYPAYGHAEADRMVVHPPTYYWVAGVLMKLGLPYFTALGINVLVGTAAAIIAMLASGFSPLSKVAFITGLYVTNFQFVDLSLARPELAISVWWLGGLFILENARTRNWSGMLLALGSFVTAYACSLHYHAWPGVAAAGVYVLACLIDLGWRKALPKLAWVSTGLAAYLVPYAICFLLPQWTAIVWMIHGVNATGPVGPKGVLAAFLQHVHDYWAYRAHVLMEGKISLLCYVFYPALALGIPSALVALPILIWRRDTRIVGLASAPLLLSMLFVVSRKFPGLYYRPEYTLLFAALFIVTVSGFTLALRRVRQLLTPTRTPAMKIRQRLVVGYMPAMVLLATGFFVVSDGDLRLAFNGHGFIDEIRLERGVAKEVIGSHAVVGGIFCFPWFTGGAAVYRDLIGELIYPPDISGIDVSALFRGMDAVVDIGVTSDLTYNKQRKTLTSFYIDGVLSLRGFYAGRLIRGGLQEKLLFMSERPATEVRAFFWQEDQFYEFNASRDGDTELVMVEVPAGREIGTFPQAEIILTMPLPGRQQAEAGPTLVMVLQGAGAFEGSNQIYPGCLLRDHIRGHVAARDPAPIIRSISYQKEIVKFY
jgi:hypothetical protein